MPHFETILCLIVLIFIANCHPNNILISSSSDLNCDFNDYVPCLWKNSNSSWERSSDWNIASTTINITAAPNTEIMPMTNGSGFLFTNATNNGLNTALYVSDVIPCQLGGAELKYWYYRTQMNSRIEICVRQQPGSLNLINQKCYDGVQSVQAHQWVYQKIQLPPVSQPFEILIRAYFIYPYDVIAIDGLSYEAVLCGANKGPLSIITYDQWKVIKENSTKESNSPMLVLAEALSDSKDVAKESALSSSNVVRNGVTVVSELDDPIAFKSTTTESSALPNIINFMKDVSPLLSELLKSVRPVQTINDAASISSLPISSRGTKLYSFQESDNIETQKKLLNSNNFATHSDVSQSFLTTTMNPYLPRKKLFAPKKQISPTKTLSNRNIQQQRASPNNILLNNGLHDEFNDRGELNKKTFDGSSSNEQNDGIIKYHRRYPKPLQTPKKKMIRPHSEFLKQKALAEDVSEVVTSQPFTKIVVSSTPDVDEEKEKTTAKSNQTFLKSAETNIDFNEMPKILTAEMINELQMITKFDDLEALTQGMDLSIITKPGGFATLRQQFLEQSLIQGSTDKDSGSFVLNDEYKAYGLRTFNKNKNDIESNDNRFEDKHFMKKSKCKAIDCDFNNEDLCEYTSISNDNDYANFFIPYKSSFVFKEWSFGEDTLGNSITGIPTNPSHTDSFIFAGLSNNKNDIFLLASKEQIHFPTPSRIMFSFYHAGIKGILKVCLDDLFNCPFSYSYQNLTINARQWQSGEVVITKESKVKVLIVAQQLSSNYIIGIDNVRLVQINSLEPGLC